MNANLEFDLCSKQFAMRIATMIETRLIWYKHYFPWCDEMIAQLDEPPSWMIEISTIKYIPNAVAEIRSYRNDQQYDISDLTRDADEYIACLLIRNRIGAISWATFLADAGMYADCSDASNDPEYFYSYLNEYEDSEYDDQLGSKQQIEIAPEYVAQTEAIDPLFRTFQKRYREHIRKNGG